VRRARSLTDQAVLIADVDGLTGCLNHRAFHARLFEVASKATSIHPLTTLVLDVDHFKAVNDGYGHLAGDEFAFLLPDADLLTAEALERRLIERLVNGALRYDGRVTIGSATSSVATDGRLLLEQADARLYAIRANERGLASLRADEAGTAPS